MNFIGQFYTSPYSTRSLTSDLRRFTLLYNLFLRVQYYYILSPLAAYITPNSYQVVIHLVAFGCMVEKDRDMILNYDYVGYGLEIKNLFYPHVWMLGIGYEK